MASFCNRNRLYFQVIMWSFSVTLQVVLFQIITYAQEMFFFFITMVNSLVLKEVHKHGSCYVCGFNRNVAQLSVSFHIVITKELFLHSS